MATRALVSLIPYCQLVWGYVRAKFVNPNNEFWEAEVDNFMAPLPEHLAMDCIRQRFCGDL